MSISLPARCSRFVASRDAAVQVDQTAPVSRGFISPLLSDREPPLSSPHIHQSFPTGWVCLVQDHQPLALPSPLTCDGYYGLHSYQDYCQNKCFHHPLLSPYKICVKNDFSFFFSPNIYLGYLRWLRNKYYLLPGRKMFS